MAVHQAVLGRFFEDYVVGDIYQHPIGRTISEADNTWITLLSMNTNQNHFNAHLAAQNPITDGKVIVNSGLTVAVVLGISVLDMSQNAISNLAFTDIKMSHPVYVGDTIYAESICTGLRLSESRPYAGIVSMITRGLNQDGTEVISWKRSVMVATRESGIGQNYFPEAKSGPLQLPTPAPEGALS
ncbi:dehydratase [Rhodococcus pyridinivorans KG-16]|uniref:Dehydratase n=1 Tax=Rhodococcus pyridinivorans KG-16 TaxID=1441730 RepID=A0A0V9UEA3_9NOCA|nr:MULTISPECIES: MaoC family dehydratase [Rhodococcus]KSZ56390.1 dehydratase [Rhodococcus pyridinivorans KG-16]MBS9372308.1 Mesaconyl-CoA hydratase [Rhodococcus sp. B50]